MRVSRPGRVSRHEPAVAVTLERGGDTPDDIRSAIAEAAPSHAAPMLVRGRLAAVSISAAMRAGAVVGFALGLAFGGIAGALVVWFAGAVIDWQRELSLMLGIARTLLPLGEQTETLRTVSQAWFLVIPIASVLGGAVTAGFAALVGGLVAAAYNRTTRQTSVLLEVGDVEPAPAVGAPHASPQTSPHQPPPDT